MQAKGIPSHKESMEVGCSQGKVDSSASPSLEIQPHFHQFRFQCLTLSFEPKEKGLREKAGQQTVFWHFECSLRQLAGVEHRLVHPVWEPFLGGGSKGAAKAAL